MRTLHIFIVRIVEFIIEIKSILFLKKNTAYKYVCCFQHRLVGGNFGKGLPLLIIGVLSAVAGLLAFILPETFRRGLTETIQEEIQVQREGLSNIRYVFNCIYVKYSIVVQIDITRRATFESVLTINS